jgi:hypothetical protein
MINCVLQTLRLILRNDLESKLPSPDDFAQFMTCAGLEDALQGI